MLNNQDQFKAAFIPYLKQFIHKAQSVPPDLAQVPIQTELVFNCINERN